MSILLDGLSWLAVLGGGAFAIIAGIGLLRLPDYFSRVHAAGVLDTLGAGLLLFALMLQGGLSLVTVKLILILVLILITGPTATHALARAALHGGHKPPVDRGDGS